MQLRIVQPHCAAAAALCVLREGNIILCARTLVRVRDSLIILHTHARAQVSSARARAIASAPVCVTLSNLSAVLSHLSLSAAMVQMKNIFVVGMLDFKMIDEFMMMPADFKTDDVKDFLVNVRNLAENRADIQLYFWNGKRYAFAENVKLFNTMVPDNVDAVHLLVRDSANVFARELGLMQ